MAKKPTTWTPKRIKALREEKNLTREQLAEKVGVQPSTVYHWELPSQKRRPNPSHCILLDNIESGAIK